MPAGAPVLAWTPVLCRLPLWFGAVWGLAHLLLAGVMGLAATLLGFLLLPIGMWLAIILRLLLVWPGTASRRMVVDGDADV